MMYVSVRISRSYGECSGICDKLVKNAVWALVFQHDADEDVARDHIHALIKFSEEYDKKKFKAASQNFYNWCKKELNLESTDYMFKRTFKKDKQDIVIDDTNYFKGITYMTKGELEPVFCKNIDDSLWLNARAAWVEKPKKISIDEYMKTLKEEAGAEAATKTIIGTLRGPPKPTLQEIGNLAVIRYTALCREEDERIFWNPRRAYNVVREIMIEKGTKQPNDNNIVMCVQHVSCILFPDNQYDRIHNRIK